MAGEACRQPSVAMSVDDLNKEAKRLYEEFQNGQIDRRHYYSEIVSLLTQPLYRYFNSALEIAQEQDQDDLFQKVVLKFLETRNRPDLRDGLSLPWFYKVARNERIDEVRKAKHSTPIEDNVYNVSDTPNSIEDRRILHVVTERAFADLSPQHREVALLYFMERLTQKEIAEIVDLPETTVNYYVSLARKHLSTNLKDFVLRSVSGSGADAG